MALKGKQSDEGELFDDWVDRYDRWFSTPVGALVKHYESKLLLEMLQPQAGELILDIGCGTGVFTLDVLASGTNIVGLDISYPMLVQAEKKTAEYPFQGVIGNMTALPFAGESFDKVFSMTALEFVADAELAINELQRVTRPGGTVVVTTLNSLSPWAERRTKEAAAGHTLFSNMTFRSPAELALLAPDDHTVKTAIHFLKKDNPEMIPAIEEDGCRQNKCTGAFVALSWCKKNDC